MSSDLGEKRCVPFDGNIAIPTNAEAIQISDESDGKGSTAPVSEVSI